MATVGVDQAKATLGRLLERVAAGETITITKHGKPIARLAPIEGGPAPGVADLLATMRSIRQRARPDPEGWTVKQLIDHRRRL